jgi:hypothetical protein
MHSSEPAPGDDPDRHPASALVLAAVQRAVRHAPQPGAEASTAAVLVHLDLAPRSAAARRAREALERLHAVGMLRRTRLRGRTCWRLAPRGGARLRALRRHGAGPVLPESPQHRAWRLARALAGRESDRLRHELIAALSELETLALAGGAPASSDALLAVGAGVCEAARRLASALHCLHEWHEPADDRADVDARDEPPGPGAEGVPGARLRDLRAGRRNVRLWDP